MYEFLYGNVPVNTCDTKDWCDSDECNDNFMPNEPLFTSYSKRKRQCHISTVSIKLGDESINIVYNYVGSITSIYTFTFFTD